MDIIKILEASEVSVEDYRKLRLEVLRQEPQAFGQSYKDQFNAAIKEWENWLNNYKKGKNKLDGFWRIWH